MATTPQKAKAKKTRRNAGGAATGGGMNFQAAVTAIAAVHLARGRPLRWLYNVTDDTPVALEAEVGGAGDDLRLLLANGSRAEVQVKKGFRVGSDLWKTLEKLAEAITEDSKTFGLLIVCPNSSGTIRESLSRDIVRIGDGRTDGLSGIGQKFLTLLMKKNHSPKSACARIRIQTVSALSSDQDAIQAARSELGHLCSSGQNINHVWSEFYEDAHQLIENRGRCDLTSIARQLSSKSISLKTEQPDAPLALLTRLKEWTVASNQTFSIFGVQHPLDIDTAWIDLRASQFEPSEGDVWDLENALHQYHSWETTQSQKNITEVDPETLGRFNTRVVLIAGPGMGKSTLLKRLSRRYARDSIPVLSVKLSRVAASIRNGMSFEEAIFSHGLDGSGITTNEARAAKLTNWTILCDGLDECGTQQKDVAEGIEKLSIGYPACRFVVTSRPSGYYLSSFPNWRYYRLLPLDISHASRNITHIVKAVASKNSDILENAAEKVSKELSDDGVEALIGRTPLLIGLSAACIAADRPLGNTRAQIFRQLFTLIDDAPNSRLYDRPADPNTLNHFLNILAWHISENPLASVSELMDRSTNNLKSDMEITHFAARSQCEKYRKYWEDVGLIERIGHAPEQILAFIHKNFGEFAAARYVSNQSPSTQKKLVFELSQDDQRKEVNRFAAKMGIGDLVIENILDDKENVDRVDNINLALEIIEEADPPLSLSNRSEVFALALRTIESDRRLKAYDIGRPFIAAARRFPDEVRQEVQQLTNSSYPWTKLIAWGALVAAGSGDYDIETLINSANEIVTTLEPDMKPSLTGGVMFSGNERNLIAQNFIIEASREIIEKASPEVADKVVPTLLSIRELQTLGFVERAAELITEKQKSYEIGIPDWQKALNTPPGYLEAWHLLFSVIFEACGADGTVGNDSTFPEPPFLNFSAFLVSSKFWEIEVSDVWAWTKDHDKEAALTVLRVFIVASGIDETALREEVTSIQSRINTSEEALYQISNLTAYVDPPQVDWSFPQERSIHWNDIEAALFHPSRWIVWIAANLADENLSKNDRKQLVRKIFSEGKRQALWAGCAIAANLENLDVLDIALHRLQEDIVPGCEFIFNLIAEAAPPLDERVENALHAGLFRGHADVACSAAKLARKISSPTDKHLAPMIHKAIDHWSVTEEPYPKAGGIIPPSPRSELITTLSILEKPEYKQIKTYLQDSRSDVIEVGIELLINHLHSPAGRRQEFLIDVSLRILKPRFLGKVLQSKVTLSAQELGQAEQLLTHENSGVQFNAMALLNSSYLEPPAIINWAQKLSSSHEQQIKDRAYRILDALN